MLPTRASHPVHTMPHTLPGGTESPHSHSPEGEPCFNGKRGNSVATQQIPQNRLLPNSAVILISLAAAVQCSVHTVSLPSTPCVCALTGTAAFIVAAAVAITKFHLATFLLVMDGQAMPLPIRMPEEPCPSQVYCADYARPQPSSSSTGHAHKSAARSVQRHKSAVRSPSSS